MNQVLQWLLPYTDNFLGALAVISVLLVLYKLKPIVEFWDSRKLNRVKQLEEALRCDSVANSPITKQLLLRQLEMERVKQATGLRIEKEFREELFTAHSTTKGEVPFLHFKKALTHINYVEGKISVDLSEKHERQDRRTKRVSYMFLAMGGLLLIPLIVNPKFPEILISTIGGVSYLIMGFYCLLIQREPYAFATKIENALIKSGYLKSNEKLI